MPIDVDALEDGPATPVKPDTNEHALLEVLVAHSELAFSAGERFELTDVPSGSASTWFACLEDRDLVRRIDGHRVVADDVVADRVTSVVSLDAIEERYGDDAYGQSDEWVDDLPDPGENA